MKIDKLTTINELTPGFLLYSEVERRNCQGTIIKKIDCLSKLIRTSGDISVLEINQFVILDMKAKFIKQKLSDSRIASLIGTLKSFLKYLKEFVELDGIYDYRRIIIPRVRSTPNEYWTQQEIDEFIEWLPEVTLKDKRLKALIVLLSVCGARIHEVTGLPRNTNLESHEAEVLGKGHHFRQIYWNDRVEHYLRLYQEARPEWDMSMFLFGTINRGNYCGQWDKNDINKTFRKISKQIGKRIYPHKLRTSFCTNSINAGMSIHIVSKLMGHHGNEAIRTTLTNYYCPLSDSQAKEEFQKFSQKFECKANITK